MLFQPKPRERRSLAWAIVLSLAIHGLVLLIPHHAPAGGRAAAPRLQARLAPLTLSPPAVPPPIPPELPAPIHQPARVPSRMPPAKPRITTAEQSPEPAVASSPNWSAAEKEEMDRFLAELADQAKAMPSLAERSLAMAREYGQHLSEEDAAAAATLELRPNAPPADPFSLEMYVDSLIKRLNRSATYVPNDPKSKGMQKAAVQFRLNPDGTLKSFVVLNAADQGQEIAFVKAVVERSLPFAAFPPDINRAVRSLAMTICILPTGGSGGGFGFSRMTDDRGC